MSRKGKEPKPNHEAGGEAEGASAQERTGLPQFISPIKSVELQVGEHVMTALQHEGTVAVLSAVVVGEDGQQRIASIPLNAELLSQVQQLVHQVHKDEVEKAPRVPCIGFHCPRPIDE